MSFMLSSFDCLQCALLLVAFGRPLDSCNGLLTLGELGFPYLPDYFAFDL